MEDLIKDLDEKDKLINLFENDDQFYQSDQEEAPIEIDLWKLIILDQNSMFCLYWNFFEVLLSIISSYVYAYMAAFGT